MKKSTLKFEDLNADVFKALKTTSLTEVKGGVGKPRVIKIRTGELGSGSEDYCYGLV